MKVCVLGGGVLADTVRAVLDERSDITPTDLAHTDIVWCCYDTPIRADGTGNYEQVLMAVRNALHDAPEGCLVVLSSQLPVGTCAQLEADHPRQRFAVVPENIRVAHARDDFVNQDRIVIGVRSMRDMITLRKILRPYTKQRRVMTPESAEMSKHALNAFLALSVAYANELRDLCERYGANADDVADALKTDRRIGPLAYLSPGPPYSTGHLEREVSLLIKLGGGPVIQAVQQSNDNQKERL